MYGRDANCLNNGLKQHLEYITVESFNILICLRNRSNIFSYLHGDNITGALIGCFLVLTGHY